MKEHVGVDGTIHDGRARSECASCIAMLDDGFVPAVKVEEAQPGWISLIGGHRQWVPDVNKLDIVLVNKASEPTEEKQVGTQSDTGDCVTCGHAQAHHRDGALPKTGVCAEYQPTQVDWVNPEHYRRGPVECIEVCRLIKDFRLASAMKYLWRVSFGGKLGEDEKQDIQKAIWYLTDYLEN